jgi:hypothetical protein
MTRVFGCGGLGQIRRRRTRANLRCANSPSRCEQTPDGGRYRHQWLRVGRLTGGTRRRTLKREIQGWVTQTGSTILPSYRLYHCLQSCSSWCAESRHRHWMRHQHSFRGENVIRNSTTSSTVRLDETDCRSVRIIETGTSNEVGGEIVNSRPVCHRLTSDGIPPPRSCSLALRGLSRWDGSSLRSSHARPPLGRALVSVDEPSGEVLIISP